MVSRQVTRLVEVGKSWPGSAWLLHFRAALTPPAAGRWASCSQSQFARPPISAASCLTCAALSLGVHQRPSLAMAIVTHLGTRPAHTAPEAAVAIRRIYAADLAGRLVTGIPRRRSFRVCSGSWSGDWNLHCQLGKSVALYRRRLLTP
jgi:hypothetical protein